METYKQVCNTLLKQSHARLIAYKQQSILCEHKAEYIPIEFEVCSKVSNVLGLSAIAELNLVKRVEALTHDPIAQYAATHSLVLAALRESHTTSQLTPHAYRPVVHLPQRVPVTIRERVKAELERMEKLNVIKNVNEPTEWVNSMVTVIKPNGKIRICIDTIDPNKAIKRNHFPTTAVEEIVSRMPKARVFSVLDASSGYWQVMLDKESAKLCTFNTPFGRYMFTRLPFGICSAQNVC